MTLQLNIFNPIRYIGEIPFISTGYYYSDFRRIIAHEIKNGNSAAIKMAALAIYATCELPKKALFVPVPSHLGYATYTLDLAHELARLTGGEVADVLKGKEREMLYERKHERKSVSVQYLGVYATEELPKDREVFYVDNVVATGTTAKAVYEAIGRGTMLTFSHSKRQT